MADGGESAPKNVDATVRESLLSPAQQTWHRLLLVSVVAALIGLAVLIAFSPRDFIYDEEFHMRGAFILANVDDVTHLRNPGPGAGIHEMLAAPIPSAPGPLYAVLHAAFYPITKLEAPQVRYLNFGLFLLSVGAIAFSLRRWRVQYPWMLTAMMLCVPMTWAVIGLAYTEIPAITMAAFGLAAAAWAATQPEGKRWEEYIGFAAAGIFAGLAILGRQTYLPIIAGFAAVALFSKRWRWPALLGGMAACLIPLPMFIIWGGLLRQDLQTPMGGGIVIKHGVVALASLATAIGLLAPGFFKTGWRWILAAAVTGVIVNVLFIQLEWKTCIGDGLLAYLPGLLGPWYNPVVGSIIVAASAGFVVAAAINFWTRRRDGLFVLALAQTILLMGPAVKIVDLYTPRYVMPGFPFMLLVAAPFLGPSRWAVARFVAGGVFGAASLSSYYIHYFLSA